MRTLALSINERDRLSFRKYLTDLYRRTGIYTVYSFPPAIVLGEGEFDRKIDIKDGVFSFGGNLAEWNGLYLLESQTPLLNEIAKIDKPGLFIARESTKVTESFTFRVKSLMLVEFSENSFSVISERPLKICR